MYFANETQAAIDILRAIIEPLIYEDKFTMEEIQRCADESYSKGFFNKVGVLIDIGHGDGDIEELTEQMREDIKERREECRRRQYGAVSRKYIRYKKN